MADFANLKTVTAIVAICFLVGLYVKKSALEDKWIPCIVGTLGGILGVVGLYVIPDFPAGNVLDAIAVGIASGLAATGGHQIYKQLFDNRPNDASLTWDQYKADQGTVTVLNTEESYDGQP